MTLLIPEKLRDREGNLDPITYDPIGRGVIKYKLLRRSNKYIVRTTNFVKNTRLDTIIDWFDLCNINSEMKLVRPMYMTDSFTIDDNMLYSAVYGSVTYDFHFATKSDAMAFILRWL